MIGPGSDKNKINRQKISTVKGKNTTEVSEASAHFYKYGSTSPFCHYCHFGKFCDIGHWSLSALFEIDDHDVDDDGNAFDKQFWPAVGLGSMVIIISSSLSHPFPFKKGMTLMIMM